MDRFEREAQMVRAFQEITGASEDSARFFLESSNWNLELALGSFLETYGSNNGMQALPLFTSERGQGDAPAHQDIVIESDPEPDQQEAGLEPVVQRHNSDNEDDNDVVVQVEVGGENVEQEEMLIEECEQQPRDPEGQEEPCSNREEADVVLTLPASSTNLTHPKSSRKFYSMTALRAQESSSDDDEGQAYYAGGSEHSGQQVVGPSRSSHDIITEIFRSLREQTDVELPVAQEPDNGRTFSGQGYRLGQTADDSQVVNVSTEQSDHSRDVILRMWRNGFTVDDGNLRSYSDPKEREFLSRIRRGNVPAEFFPNAEAGSTINLALEDNRHKNYSPPTGANVETMFVGQGHVLGSGSDTKENEESLPEVEEVPVKKPPPVETVSVQLDPQQPTTVIQVRLPNGSRIQVTLNHNNTVADLRNAIIASHPEFSGGNFTLTASYPRRELENDQLTLKEADILGSSLFLIE